MANHGTVRSYGNGCRCDECKAAKSVYTHKWNATNPNKGKHYAANRDKVLEARREYYAANRDKVLESQRKYYEANRDERREASRAYYEANRDKAREAGRRWVMANPDKAREIWMRGVHARRARKIAAFVEFVDHQTVYERDGWLCHICGKAVSRKRKHPDPLSVSLDHIVPLSKGGEHSYDNCATSHLRCNVRKHAKLT